MLHCDWVKYILEAIKIQSQQNFESKGKRGNFMEKEFQKLRRFNLIMGGLHLVQGILMLFLATSVIQKIAEFSPKIT